MAKKEDKKGIDIGAILGKGSDKEVDMEVIGVEDDMDESDDFFMGDDDDDTDIRDAEVEIESRLASLFDGDEVKAASMLEIFKDFLDLHK
jgi:hypothetical protein